MGWPKCFLCVLVYLVITITIKYCCHWLHLTAEGATDNGLNRLATLLSQWPEFGNRSLISQPLITAYQSLFSSSDLPTCLPSICSWPWCMLDRDHWLELLERLAELGRNRMPGRSRMVPKWFQGPLLNSSWNPCCQFRPSWHLDTRPLQSLVLYPTPRKVHVA